MYPGTHARTNPDRPAAIHAATGQTLTFGELEKNSAALAAALHGLGLRKGDVIALLSDNSLETFEVYWAAIRSGLYVTLVNWHLSPDEASYIITDSAARVLIASGGVGELAEKIVGDEASVEHRYAFGAPIAGYAAYAELLAEAGPALIDQPRGSEMLYSSGTTGRPKGIKPRLAPVQVDEPGDGTDVPSGEADGRLHGEAIRDKWCVVWDR